MSVPILEPIKPDLCLLGCLLFFSEGFQLSRATLSKIEAQLSCVTEAELVTLGEALKVEVPVLLPPRPRRNR